MRYTVKKTENEKEYEFTHIWEQENLDGEMIEVIKGRNVINIDNLIKALNDTKADRDNQFQIIDNNINEMEKMLEAINTLDREDQ